MEDKLIRLQDSLKGHTVEDSSGSSAEPRLSLRFLCSWSKPNTWPLNNKHSNALT